MNVLIAGGGRIGGALAARLVAEGHVVTVVERDARIADRLFQRLGVLCFIGEATDPEMLQRASVATADVIVGALPNDAANLAFVMVARSFTSARLMVRMLDEGYRRAYRLAGVRDVIAESEIVVGKIITAIDFPLVVDALPLRLGKQHLVEIPISPRAHVVDKTLAEVRREPGFPHDCLFIALLDADGSVKVPDGQTPLRGGQTAILVAPRDELPTIIAKLTDQVAGAEQITVPQLRRVDFLAPLTDEDLGDLVRTMNLNKVPAGETIFRHGETGEHFYVVLTGEVELLDPSGTSVERVSAGGFFGEVALLTGEPRLTSARASAATELAVLGRDAFRRVLMGNPAIALEMTKILGHRLSAAARSNRQRKRGLFG